MKKDKLLEEFNAMKVSNPQEFVGGQQKLVEYTTFYSTYRQSNGTIGTTDKFEDSDTDYYDDEFVTDPEACKEFLGMK